MVRCQPAFISSMVFPHIHFDDILMFANILFGIILMFANIFLNLQSNNAQRL